MKVLVTGATGFVGGFLVKRLIKSGDIVTCLVRNLEKAESLKRFGAKLIKGDLKDSKIIQIAVKGQDLVYHLAAIGNSSFVSKKDYHRYYEINAGCTKNLLEGCRNKKIKKIVHFSSIAVMGLTKDEISDESSICYPVAPYQRSKYETEKIILDYYDKYNLPVVIIRPTMIYGPGNVNFSEILRMAKFIKKGIFPLVGNGKNAIPLVHVEDVVNGAILASKHGKPGEVYIITNDKNYSFNEIIKAISNEIGKKVFIFKVPKIIAQIIIAPMEFISKIFKFKPIFTLKRIESMTANRVFSVEKAKKDLKYKQEISMEEGIKETIAWYKNNNYL